MVTHTQYRRRFVVSNLGRWEVTRREFGLTCPKISTFSIGTGSYDIFNVPLRLSQFTITAYEDVSPMRPGTAHTSYALSLLLVHLWLSPGFAFHLRSPCIQGAPGHRNFVAKRTVFSSPSIALRGANQVHAVEMKISGTCRGLHSLPSMRAASGHEVRAMDTAFLSDCNGV